MISLFLLFAALGARSVAHAVRIRDLRLQSHGQLRRRLRAAVEAEHLIPALARLVCSLWGLEAALGSWLAASDPDGTVCMDAVTNELQQVNYLHDIAQLSHLYADLSSVDRLYAHSIGWARFRGAVAALAVAIGLMPAMELSFASLSLVPARVAWVLAGVAVLLAVIAVSGWRMEVSALNALARLGERYE